MQLDIDNLNERFESKLELLDDLARNVEHLERESRKSTMSVFGLPENENHEVLKALVAEKVLKAACPEEDWEPDDMIRAFRAGKATEDQPRMVIVTFRYSDDKFSIYNGRDSLRNKGIRVSDDLTPSQRKELRVLKTQGKTGYFVKDELKIRPKQSSFVNVKKLQKEPDSKRMRLNLNPPPQEQMDYDSSGDYHSSSHFSNEALTDDQIGTSVELGVANNI